jgi:hypothetical protein
VGLDALAVLDVVALAVASGLAAVASVEARQRCSALTGKDAIGA